MKMIFYAAKLIANQIMVPSYISLHYALAYNGMIPETIVQVTSVIAQKTSKHESQAGVFTYQTMKIITHSS